MTIFALELSWRKTPEWTKQGDSDACLSPSIMFSVLCVSVSYLCACDFAINVCYRYYHSFIYIVHPCITCESFVFSYNFFFIGLIHKNVRKLQHLVQPHIFWLYQKIELKEMVIIPNFCASPAFLLFVFCFVILTNVQFIFNIRSLKLVFSALWEWDLRTALSVPTSHVLHW